MKRHDGDLAQTALPLALYERQNNAMRLVALDRRAEECGLVVGQSLSDARAIYPQLIAREIDRDFTAGLFGQFADWHTNMSPIVAVADDQENFGDLVLDIYGVTHLFGGAGAMLQAALARLQVLGFAVRGAVAPSVGAALALARYAPGQVIEEEDWAEVLAGLPIGALRITPEQVAGLHQMGLKTIGQLYGRDRGALLARFGGAVLTRLDQALGGLEERVAPRLPVPEHMAMRKFAEPISLMADVLGVAADLAEQVSAQLLAAGVGAQSFHLLAYRVDHKLMHLAVNSARASRDGPHITRLFANRMERLVEDFDAGFGIEEIRLYASSVTEMDMVQTGAFGAEDGAADIDQLVDRLASRLGPEVILNTRFANSHIPEKAVSLAPAIAPQADAPEALPDPDLKRPLRLLPQPEDIRVMAEVPDAPPARMVWRRLEYRFVKASGPERIAVEWWQPGDGAFTRDYYVCEDEKGCRFWLFREGLYALETGEPRWFMHGLFA